ADYVIEDEVAVRSGAGRNARTLSGAAGLGPQELGLVGEREVPDVFVAQVHLRDGARPLLKEGGVGQGDPVRLLARVGAADAAVDAAEDPTAAGALVEAAVAGVAAGVAAATTTAFAARGAAALAAERRQNVQARRQSLGTAAAPG